MTVIPLKLIDEKFYHLDTCFYPLLDDTVMYYPEAFNSDSLQIIEKNVAENKSKMMLTMQITRQLLSKQIKFLIKNQLFL